jgi:hypothetical protein
MNRPHEVSGVGCRPLMSPLLIIAQIATEICKLIAEEFFNSLSDAQAFLQKVPVTALALGRVKTAENWGGRSWRLGTEPSTPRLLWPLGAVGRP